MKARQLDLFYFSSMFQWKINLGFWRSLGLLALSCAGVRAQPGYGTTLPLQPEKNGPPVFFERMTWKEGVPRGDLLLGFPDRDGFLWLSYSSSGLYRYDGYEYKHYPLENEGALSIGRPFIKKAFYDASGTLWFSMMSGGLVRYDPQQDCLKIYPFTLAEQTKQAEFEAAPDKKGRIWLVANSGGFSSDSAAVFYFDPAAGKFHTCSTGGLRATAAYGKEKTVELPNGQLLRLEADQEGRLWTFGLDEINGLYSFDPATGKWTFYPAPDGYYFHSATTIYPDEDGEWIWSSAWNAGLTGFNKKTMEWLLYPNGASYMGISNKDKNQLWLAEVNHGTCLFDKKLHKLWQYDLGADKDKLPLPGTREGLAKDPATGIVWEFGEKGLNKIDPSLQNFVQKPAFASHAGNGDLVVTNFYSDTIDQVFYITALDSVADHYLLAWHEKGNRWRSRKLKKTEIIENMFVRDSQGKLWASCMSGFCTKINQVFQVDPATLAFTPMYFQAENNPASNLLDLWRGLPMPNGDLWFCSRHSGLFHFDAGRQMLHQYFPLAENPDGTRQTTDVREAVLDKYGRIWLAVRGGLVRLDPEPKHFEVFKNIPGDTLSLPSDQVMTLVLDKQQRLWIGTLAGLCYLDLSAETAVQGDGKPLHFHRVGGSGYTFVRMVLDCRGKIWAKVQEGLYSYDPIAKQGRLYDEMDGLLNDTGDRIGISPSGEIFWGDKCRFRPEAFVENNTPPRVVFTHFKNSEKEAALPRSINHTDTLRLRYNANFFTIEFAALNFTQPWRNTYRYRLAGFDPEWVDAGTRHAASYTNVPPGGYVFEVMAANNDGYPCEAPRRLCILIAPPWWGTWWFRLIAALTGAAALAVAYRLRVGHIHQQAAIREKELEIKNLEETYRRRIAETEMAALRAQMNPHFIFNCLNSIKLYTSENDSETATKYLSKFARLIRLVLENSRSEKVSLANELEALELYIQLEAMRFKSKVRYFLQIEEGIDLQYVQIPPLLLQPFVENAIWHGLMHKMEGGTVTVELWQPSEVLLQVVITDDGVGRSQAEAYNSKSAVKHKSLGMQVTSERLRAVNDLFGVETKVSVLDLMGEDGEPAGTQVILEIPV